jgi:hypothetical protein
MVCFKRVDKPKACFNFLYSILLFIYTILSYIHLSLFLFPMILLGFVRDNWLPVYLPTIRAHVARSTSVWYEMF